MGIAILDEHEQTSEDETWIVDHSNQIGQEKILVINRLRNSDLPPPGKTLKRSNLKTIATVAGKSWAKPSASEDESSVYELRADAALGANGLVSLESSPQPITRGDHRSEDERQAQLATQF